MKEIVSLSEAMPGAEAESWMADVAVYPAGEKRSLIYAKSTGAVCLVHAAYSELLAQCREFRTLDEHLSAFYQQKQISGTSLSTEVVQGLRYKLQQLAQAGYLIPQSQISALFKETDGQASPTHITTIGFPTCDRVKTLQSTLISYVKNCQRFGRSPEFVVMDDSPSPTTREEYRAMLRGLQKRYALNIAYAGLEERIAYIRKLSEMGKIPEEVVSWACVGDRTYGASLHGANRNALLFHTVGECFFSSDDDTFCRVASSPGFEDGLVLRCHWDHIQYWYYSDREGALEAAPVVEQDILALHEQWLGQDPRVSGAPYSRTGQFTAERVEPSFLRRFAMQPGKIALTMNGIIGDASHRTSDFLFFSPEESFKRMMSSEQIYQLTQTSREIAQAVRRLTLTANIHHVLNIGGLDNRELLPPFIPTGWAEDYAFGLMLSRCFPDAYAAYLPWILLHAPPEARSYTEPIFTRGGYITKSMPFYEWLPRCIAHFSPKQISTPVDRLSELGLFLESIARLPTLAFEEFARHLLWKYDGELISQLEQRLRKEEGYLASNRRDIEAYCGKVRQIMVLPIKQRLEGGAELAQRAMMQFAQILHWWPAMLETARCLRAEGCRLAQPL